MVKRKCCPELVQVHESRSVRPGLSVSSWLSRGSIQVKSSPVQSSRPTGFGQVLSDQPAASRLEHCRSPGCDVDTTGPMPYRLDYEYWLILS
ncbi:hypothetical protein F2Q69_00047149 [Brassica cretica]|uniref:Uncharacterized protein n=1 Tax=Brassica cretica TaxID=69181 RepID=A0A8S9PUD2_BRACR|nr:hypothetical protein F2Q69_00047149 [Brassica cretica]